MCGVCPFYSGDTSFRFDGKERAGFCMAFRKKKRKYDNIPARCSKLFKKGFDIGGDLVIVYDVDVDDVVVDDDVVVVDD
jgi:hypothetical protein